MTLELALLLLGGVFILLPGVVVIVAFFAKAAALDASHPGHSTPPGDGGT